MLPNLASRAPDYRKGRRTLGPAAQSLRLTWTNTKEGAALRIRWGVQAAKVCTRKIAALRLIPFLVEKINVVQGFAFPANETIAEAVGCDIATVKNGLSEMIALGVVQVEHQRGGKNGGNRRKIYPALPVADGDTGTPSGRETDGMSLPADGDTGTPADGYTVAPADGKPVSPIKVEEKLDRNIESKPDAGAVDPVIRSRMDSEVEQFARHLWRVSAGEKTVKQSKLVDGAEAWVADLLGPYPEGRRRLYLRPDRLDLIGYAVTRHGEEARRIANDRLVSGGFVW